MSTLLLLCAPHGILWHIVTVRQSCAGVTSWRNGAKGNIFHVPCAIYDSGMVKVAFARQDIFAAFCPAGIGLTSNCHRKFLEVSFAEAGGSGVPISFAYSGSRCGTITAGCIRNKKDEDNCTTSSYLFSSYSCWKTNLD